MSLALHPTSSSLVSTEGQRLPLRGASIRVDARGGLGRVVLEQRFENPHAEILAVTYRLPLPADGAVSGFSFRVGGRRIVGEVDGRAAARDRFEQAVIEGRGAALLEEERSSLFTQQIHGIPPGAELVAEITVDQRLAWLEEGAWEWRFPTAAAPRYLGGPADTPDADHVSVEVADAPLPARFSLALAVRDAIVERRQPESPSHPIACRVAGGSVHVSLASGDAPLDRDVVIRWPVARPAAGATLDLARPARAALADSAYALVSLVPPSPGRAAAPVPRDLTILLDRSGSMAGEPIAQARRVCAALIEGLSDQDTVELLSFGSDVTRFLAEPARATPTVRRAALSFLAEQQAGGGTEMRSGILAAIGALRPAAQRQVVVVSDGLIGFEEATVRDLIELLPASSRVHTVGVGSAVNRSFTAAAARAGRGVEVILGLGEDPERAARRLLARTHAPLVVDVTLAGDAISGGLRPPQCPPIRATAPARLPDLFAGAPALVTARVRPEGGDLVVRGHTAEGTWEQRLRVPPTAPGAGNQGIVSLFGRESVEDAEMHRCAGESPAAFDAMVERLGIDFQIATRLTSWVAVDAGADTDPGAPVRKVRIPQQLPAGMSAEALGLRAPAGPAGSAAPPSGGSSPDPTPSPRRPSPRRTEVADFDEKTRVTQVVAAPPAAVRTASTDCLVVVYTKEPTLLGKRFVLEEGMIRIGRGGDGNVVLEADSVSRRHAHLERRGGRWLVVDDGSTNGTYVNDEQIAREAPLRNGDQIKIGPTIFKFLSGADVEAQYHEEIYRMTIMDGLTEVHNKRYLLEALERELIRARRHQRALSVLMIDVDHFKRVNDGHGHLAGDFVLKEICTVIKARLRRDEVLARYGGEELAVVLPETALDGAVAAAERIREAVRGHRFVFQGSAIAVTVSVGAAALDLEGEEKAVDLIRRADTRLYEAKRGGRDQVRA